MPKIGRALGPTYPDDPIREPDEPQAPEKDDGGDPVAGPDPKPVAKKAASPSKARR